MPKIKIFDMNNEFDRQLIQLFKLAREIRGQYLEQSIAIEKIIEDIISWHFCPEEKRRSLFFSLVINGSDITFSSKIDIFEKVLRLHYEDIYKKYPRLNNSLAKIRRFRNRVAHSSYDTSDNFLAKKLTDRIHLLYFEDGQTKCQIVTDAEIHERLKECSRIIIDLVNIQEEVKKRVLATYK